MPSKSDKKKDRAYRTDWDPLAAWYDGWVGEAGSKHHRLVAIPALMELIEPKKRENVLDIGCGQGVLFPYIEDTGANYFGVDLSENMVRIATNRYKDRGTFVVGDAMSLDEVSEISDLQFEIVIFLLSLQDLDPLEDAVRAASKLLKDGGRVGILMTHPCFRIPRQSGWGWDENRKLRFRRIDSYLSRLAVPLKPYPGKQKGTTRSFHRPLQDYVAALTNNSFVIDRLIEVPTYKKSQSGEQSRAVNRANREIPLFLGIRARKITG